MSETLIKIINESVKNGSSVTYEWVEGQEQAEQVSMFSNIFWDIQQETQSQASFLQDLITHMILILILVQCKHNKAA